MDWLERFDVVLMNADDKCEGVYTWKRGNQRSAIDFILVNEYVYERCGRMIIDEDKEVIDFSDHCLVTMELGLRGRPEIFRKGEYVERVYYRRDKEALQEVKDRVMNEWQEGMRYEDMWRTLEEIQDQVLRRKVRKRVGERKGTKVEEAEWVTDELR